MVFFLLKKYTGNIYRKFIFNLSYKLDDVRTYTDKKKPIPVSMAFRVVKSPQSKDDKSIVILHGILGSKRNWSTMAIKLMHCFKCTVYTVDTRNHGYSPKSEEFNYEHLGEDVRYFLKERKLKKAILLGHGMGGRTALFVALTYPEIVDDLVIVDITPIGEINKNTRYNIKAVMAAVEQVSFQNVKTLHDARVSAQNQLRKKLDDEFVINFLMMSINQLDPTRFGWLINLPSLKKNFEKYIDKFPKIKTTYDKRTLFIYGKESDFVLPEYIKKTKAIFPKAVFVGMKTGHLPHIKLPETFVNTVCDYLKNKK